MARPKTKDELLAQSQASYAELLSLFSSLNEEEQSAQGVNGDWSAKDVLSHLSAWQRMFFIWYEAGMGGEKAAMPAPGYSWKETPALNEQIYLEHKHESAAHVLAELENSHTRSMDILRAHSNAELFTKKRYKWTGTTSIGSYAVSSTSSHYQWAIDLIKKWQKTKAA